MAKEYIEREGALEIVKKTSGDYAAESSEIRTLGKTTLTRDLGKYFNAPYSWEWERDYIKESCISDREFDSTDFMAFLEGQYNLNKKLINSAGNHGVFFADSDSMTTRMYAEQYAKEESCVLTQEEFEKIAVMADEYSTGALERDQHGKGSKNMKAWHRYVERQKNQVLKDVVMENCDAYIEHMDLIMLWVLHTEFGFGAERLKRAYHAIDKKFNEFRRYMADDRTKFNEGTERMDTYALKYKLREIGFDYEEEVKKGVAKDIGKALEK